MLEEGPEELTVTLMTHQKRALAWLRWREEQIPCGGILGMYQHLTFDLCIDNRVGKTVWEMFLWT